MPEQDRQSLFARLGKEICYPYENEAELLGITNSTPEWFWSTGRGGALRFAKYERTKGRHLAEYLWQGNDPDAIAAQDLTFFLGFKITPEPSRLAYFTLLDSLAVFSWRSASLELKERWLAEVGSWVRLDSTLAADLPLPALAHRLWVVAWRWLGHRKWEWMEHQLSTVSEALRIKAGLALVELIPALGPESPLWQAVRYGLYQDAVALYEHLRNNLEEADALESHYVKKRRDSQTRLRGVFASFSEVCARCAASGGSCCSRDIPHYYFSKADLSYLKGSGATLPEFDESAASGNHCIFIGPEGCRFPAELRPAVCLSHTCDAIYYKLSPQEKSLLTRFELRRLLTMRDED